MNSNSDNTPGKEVTPESVYLNRRTFMRAGLLAASVAATTAVYRRFNPRAEPEILSAPLANLTTAPTTLPSTGTDSGFRVNEPLTSFHNITHYNNFYEFSTSKDAVAAAAAGFVTTGWKVAVDGLVRKPRVFDLDDLLKIAPPQERIYRMRCVEGWSMVIPWAGYSLRALLDQVEPLSAGKYVSFESLNDPARMPNLGSGALDWPYVEGLRMDEAMHPLTLLASGLYGKQMPPQDGAPVRLIVPWKYGFKGAKSLVKISVVADQPKTTWSDQAPSEYGFYANVNPKVDHPRWSQATERRIGESGRRDTLMFNGYAEQVGALYTGMDLHKFF